MKTILRKTEHFTAVAAKRPGYVTIRANSRNVTPSSRTVKPKTWAELSSYSDSTFETSVAWELGVGAFSK